MVLPWNMETDHGNYIPTTAYVFSKLCSDKILFRLYSLGLMNSFRTETFNVTGPGCIESFFLQGGQRWQTVTLLTNTSIDIRSIGFRPSVSIEPTDKLPGSFSASNEVYDGIWSLGARAVQAACVEKGSQPSVWELTSQGALIRGQYPGFSAKGTVLGNYTMSFWTKIVQGGTGWRVAVGANAGYGPYFVLNAQAPQLVNTDHSLLPPNSITAGFGFSIINETILGSAPVQHFGMPFPIRANDWYQITTTIEPTGYNISINGHNVAFMPSGPLQPYINPSWGSATTTDGTWGFGPFLDQSAYYKDVKVTSQDGTVLYTDSLMNEDVLAEYAVATNPRSFCLDGAKRDRLVWVGDFTHTARELAASTGRYDFVQSMIDFVFDWQLLSGPGAGLVPIQSDPGTGYAYRESFYPSQYGETDYQIFFLVILGDYFALTGDTALLSQHWNGTKTLVETIVSRYLDPTTNLMAASDASWFTAQGYQNATAPTALMAIALNQLVTVAQALHDSTTAYKYTMLYNKLSSAINDQLWSPSQGAYSLALSAPNDTSILAIAYTIRAGIANASRAATGIERLGELFYEIGYKDSTVIGNSADTQLSPNVQGFLLESLFLARTQLNVSANTVVPVLENLFDLYWPSMVNQNEYYTGASWEYVYPDGSPGIGIFTSLCHPWGGAPTYILSEYVLGIRRELNRGTGQYVWVFDPVYDVAIGLNLTWVKGRVPLLGGGYIEASWSVTEPKYNGKNHIRWDAKVVGSKDTRLVIKNKNPMA